MATSYEDSENVIQAPLTQEQGTNMPEHDLPANIDPANTDEEGSTPRVSKSTIMAVFVSALSCRISAIPLTLSSSWGYHTLPQLPSACRSLLASSLRLAQI